MAASELLLCVQRGQDSSLIPCPLEMLQSWIKIQSDNTDKTQKDSVVTANLIQSFACSCWLYLMASSLSAEKERSCFPLSPCPSAFHRPFLCGAQGISFPAEESQLMKLVICGRQSTSELPCRISVNLFQFSSVWRYQTASRIVVQAKHEKQWPNDFLPFVLSCFPSY